MSTTNAAIQNEFVKLDALKMKQKATWEDGDYARFARYMEAGAIEVLDNWNIDRDSKLLDIACGSGQTSIPAAKNGINVTGIDIAENLIEHARKRALIDGLSAQFDVGDAEALPYDDNQFDDVITMFGAMFAPRPDKVSAELARVLRSGGQLHMANWTPQGMPAQMFKAVAGVVPPPPGFISPVLWGDEETVLQRLEKDFTDIQLKRKIYTQWQYPFDTTELVNLFRTYFGPVKRAFETLNSSEQFEFHQALEAIYRANSEYHNGVLTIVGGEYLEVIATRK